MAQLIMNYAIATDSELWLLGWQASYDRGITWESGYYSPITYAGPGPVPGSRSLGGTITSITGSSMPGSGIVYYSITGLNIDWGVYQAAPNSSNGIYRARLVLAGDDIILGSDSNDTLVGYDGDDSITGGRGDDSLSGELGKDSIYGGEGNDRIDGGGDGGGVLDGSFGNDTISGGEQDSLYGGEGNDRLSSGGGSVVDGGAGDDVIASGSGSRIDGGAGLDTLRINEWSFSRNWGIVASDGGYTVTFHPEYAPFFIRNVEQIEFRGGDIWTIERALARNRPQGTPGNDTITGSEAPDRIDGLEGHDWLAGLAGNDTIYGGDGVDTLDGGLGDDFLYGGTTSADLRDVIYGGNGNDSIDGGAGNDLLHGGLGRDSIDGGLGADTLIANDGDDVILGGGGSDVIFGNAGNDFINGGFGYDRLNGGDGADRFFHQGVADHGSDWIQDYNAAQGDRLVAGIAGATASQFQVNIASNAGTGAAGVAEAFVIYRPTGQILWALVDGAGQTSINLQIGGQVFDLLA